MTMANYLIHYACGHNETKQLYGKHTAREQYIEWAAKSGTCSCCKANDAAAATAAIETEHGLPALTGSDKQIAWARTLRATAVKAVADFVNATRARCPADKIAELEGQAEVVLQALAGKADARYWIDSRDMAAHQRAAALYKEATGK